MRRFLLAAAVWIVAVVPAGCEVVRLSLDGTINPATSSYVVRGLREASQAGAELVVLVLEVLAPDVIQNNFGHLIHGSLLLHTSVPLG